ncbi:hypothetical protein SB659_19170, partial [Arthrobacter sp. SIMBA_036]|uniref:hypothetical protein n=1 Tax=Arthrobacter sp. SIMBA_036 TaxID=3085778 RepID=UPI0039789B01
ADRPVAGMTAAYCGALSTKQESSEIAASATRLPDKNRSIGEQFPLPRFVLPEAAKRPNSKGLIS